MNDTATAIETFIGKHLHNELFLEEYVFPRSKFRTPDRLELELADAVVALGDVLLICQIKERDPESVGDEETERRWFRNAVLKDATKQVRNTLRYLQDHAEINVVNERGRTYNLSATAYASVIKIVLYLSPVRLPADCASTRYHVSGTAGFIHVVGAQDYRNVFRTLRVPAEIVAYFAYREAVLTRFGDRCGTLPEPCLVGHFVGHDLDQVPTIGSALALHALVQDEDRWDMARL